MTIADHKKWKAYFLKIAKKEVARRDYLGASSAYGAAAHHEAVAAAIRALTHAAPEKGESGR